jgi:hypothetical protein
MEKENTMLKSNNSISNRVVVMSILLAMLFIPAICTAEVLYEQNFEGVSDVTVEGLWHLSTDCEAATEGHTTPTALYYGQDGDCDYDTGNINQGVATLPIIDLPADANYIELRFKYFLETEVYESEDIASVEISVDGGDYVIIADNDTAGNPILDDPTSGWQEQVLVLTDYAGSSVQIRFGFDTVSSLSNNYPGFYVDDITVSRYSLDTTLYEQLFESDEGDFLIDNDFGYGNGLWHFTTDCQAASNGALYFGIDGDCNYDDYSQGAVTSPDISLPANSSHIEFRFAYFLETEAKYLVDIAKVQISENSGSWITLAQNDDTVELGDTTILELFDPSSGWLEERFDLTEYAGSSIQLRFSFNTTDGAFNNYPGFYIDDILILASIDNAIPPDFNADFKTDVLWRNIETGVHSVTLMDGLTKLQSSALGGNINNWTIVDLGDFNGDGKSDLLWRNIETGVHSATLMDGLTKLQSSALGGNINNWTIVVLP